MPSVTEVSEPYFKYMTNHIPEGVIDQGAKRGTEIHDYCLDSARGLWVPFPAHYGGYCDSFDAWMDRCVEKVIAVEPELSDPILGFVGHPDLIIIIRGSAFPSVVDLKTPKTKNKLWRLQIAAYYRLAEAKYGLLSPGGCLRLKEDGGTAVLDRYEYSESDFAYFMMALNLWKLIFSK